MALIDCYCRSFQCCKGVYGFKAQSKLNYKRHQAADRLLDQEEAKAKAAERSVATQNHVQPPTVPLTSHLVSSPPTPLFSPEPVPQGLNEENSWSRSVSPAPMSPQWPEDDDSGFWEGPLATNNEAIQGQESPDPETLSDDSTEAAGADDGEDEGPPIMVDDAEDDDLPPVKTLTELAKAFEEPAQLRLAYLQAIVGHTFHGLTVKQATQSLRNSLSLLRVANALPATTTAPATTLTSAKRRFGLQVDDYIEKRPICTACYKYYPMDNIKNMTSPKCTEPRYKGIVYREKRVREGSGLANKRYPAKIHAYSSLVKTLRRFFLRPDFVNNLIDRRPYRNRPPSDDETVMHDIYDGERWLQNLFGMARTRDANGMVRDIEQSPGSKKLLINLDFGFSITLNMDWFGVTDGRPHSAGALYGVINELHRCVRYLPHNVYAMTIPGPKEPSLEQLNHVLVPIKNDLLELYTGVRMRYYQENLPPVVNVIAHMNASDIPASRKASGAAGHSHNIHPCNICNITLDDINQPAGYDISAFKLKDEFDLLKHAFKSMDATTKKEREAILDKHGVRHSELNWLPGWLPAGRSPLDFMHNFYGQVKEFWMSVIVDGYLLDKQGWNRFEKLVNKSIWPSTIGCLPDNLGSNHSLQKADQWRRLCNIQPTLLWLLWHDNDDRLPTTEPSVPSQAKNKPKFKRHLKDIYELALHLSVAERLLAARGISMHNVKKGVRHLQQFCQRALRLGIHLTINNHLGMHYEEIFRRFGPAYAFWLFGFERFNGYLKQVNVNGKAGGEMELTLLRDWISKQLLHDLITNLPDDVTAEELNLVNQLDMSNNRGRGTLATRIAGFQAENQVIPSKIPKKPVDLRSLPHPEVYGLILEHLRCRWPGHHVVDDFSPQSGALCLDGSGSAFAVSFFYRNGVRYGAASSFRTDADRFACANIGNTCKPVRILYHFRIVVAQQEPELISIVQALHADEAIPSFPWDR